MTVENTYAAVDELELNRLFDRFYRADKIHNFNGGYGIGLSMAKAIIEKHKGESTAYRKNSAHIGFRSGYDKSRNCDSGSCFLCLVLLCTAV